jgi:putative ABC transport system substrate-binding protein
MRRREFIALAGGSLAMLPHIGSAQQQDAVRRVGVLTGGPNDARFQSDLAAFRNALRELGWVEGRNVAFAVHSGDNSAARLAAAVKDLVRSKPDVILAGPSNALRPLSQETKTIPIVFVRVSNPVGQGFVKTIARPEGNITGFSNLEFSLAGKWLQTLKEIVPGMKRVALMIHTSNAVSASWYRQFEPLAASFGVEPVSTPVGSLADIERTIETLGRARDSGLIGPGDTFIESPPVRDAVVKATAAHRVPAIYSRRDYAVNGGLMSYGPEQAEQYRDAASYVDRILKGASPAELPVQQPSKFYFVINLKTARGIGLDIPLRYQQLADEVIE